MIFASVTVSVSVSVCDDNHAIMTVVSVEDKATSNGLNDRLINLRAVIPQLANTCPSHTYFLDKGNPIIVVKTKVQKEEEVILLRGAVPAVVPPVHVSAENDAIASAEHTVHSDVTELCEHAANNESKSVGNIDGV